MSDFGDTTFHTGIKDHRCIWCGETIPKGEVMAHYKGQWEGDWQNWRMHRDCYDASNHPDYREDGFTPYEHERGSTEEKGLVPVRQVQTSGPQCKKCGAFTTYARVESHGLCMKCEIESSPKVSPGE